MTDHEDQVHRHESGRRYLMPGLRSFRRKMIEHAERRQAAHDDLQTDRDTKTAHKRHRQRRGRWPSDKSPI